MKTQFNKQEIIDNKGCYTIEQVSQLSFINQEFISLIDILNSEISLKDKRWFLFNKSDLTLDQKKQFALNSADCVQNIYNNKYPLDTRVSDCIQAIKDYNLGKITKDKLITKKNAAADAAYAAAADAAAAAYAAAAAADAAAADAAAYAAAYAAAADAAAADAAAYAADAAENKTHSEKLLNMYIQFVISNS